MSLWKKIPSFGFPGDKKPTACRQCSKDGMEDIVSRKCLCGKSRPNFGFPGDERPTACRQCSKDGMENIVNRKCLCGKSQPVFGFPGDKKPTCCKGCSKDGMEDIVNRKCLCGKSQPHFGFPGDKKPTACRQCSKDGMINIVSHICQGSACNGDRFIGMFGTPKYDGYCSMCFKNDFPDDPRSLLIYGNSWELKTRDFLINELPEFNFIHDQPIWTSDCNCAHRRRIDFRIQIENTLLCIEVDEREHKSYDEQDEINRYDDVFSACGHKLIFIRFNPDPYRENGILKNHPIMERLNALRVDILDAISYIPSDDWQMNDVKLLEITHMYYSS
jgi:hypothetical protein